MRILPWATLAAATAATAAVAVPGVAQAACPVPSGAEVSFAYRGTVQQVQVPEGVVKVQVYARGGHGGKEPDTAQGGQGGTVYATVPVTPGQCLDVYVGGYGGGHGGFGWGRGGDHGTTPTAGKDGAGGGGGSAVVVDGGSSPLVVAGGGGGGGGGSEYPNAYPGGAGGDGANGEGPGTPDGSDGDNPALYPHPYIGGDGSVESGRNGADGHGTSVFGIFTGAGGAGGGGYRGGDGGSGPPVTNDQKFSVIRGGGGGGGGGSYAVRDATGTSFGVENLNCPDGGQPDCAGAVTLSWIEVPAHVAAYGGSGQSTVIGTRFPRPLQARVTSASGIPVPQVDVTFTLPQDGPTARFDAGAPSRSVTVTTDRQGIATTPALVAGTEGGDWSATATAQGVSRPAGFALHDAPARTLLALYSPANPSVSGEPIRFAAAVGAAPSAAGTPTGVVEFRVDGQRMGDPVALDAAGTALSPPVSTLTPGTHDITASFDGGRSFLPSDGAVTQKTETAATVVALTSSANPAPASTPVTFTATVAASPPGGGTPTGTVQFRVDGSDVGAPVALAAGAATSAPVSGLAPGGHTIEAVYAGDEAYTSSSATMEQTTGDGVAAVTVGVPAGATPYGDPVPVSATVTTGATGSVSFSVDGTPACSDVSLDGSGQAACTLPGTLAPGAHDIVADYAGDGSFAPAQGRARHRVDPARTGVTVAAIPSPSVFGAQVALHADVTPQAPGAGTPTGSVLFLVDGAAVGAPVALGPDGASSDPLDDLQAGPHVIEAVYTGDARFRPAQHQATTAVDPSETAATITSSAPLAALSQPVTFSVSLSAISPGAGTPQGTVRFRIDGEPFGPAVRLRDGAATSDPAVLALGDHDVRASFTGDDDWLAAEATMVQAVVAPVGPATGVTPAAPTPTGAGGDAGGPLVPTVPPATDSTPSRTAMCGATFLVTRLGLRAGHIELAGVAQADLAGRRVAVRRGDRRLARATVEADGTFHATARRPAGRHADRTVVRVWVAGEHSGELRLRRPVWMSAPSPSGASAVRVVLHGPRRARVVLEGRTRCGQPMRAVRHLRLDGRGRASVALPRPATGADDAVYELRMRGRRAATSLPIVLSPAR
jgi:hypothetical protein